ncbi:MAG: cytochrome c biogenesis protein ResB [Candidatus Omnitrophica bacterium]|nr:cytochrome c biogenesis protein ResB [Candidatus Omnitrophota bacterium]
MKNTFIGIVRSLGSIKLALILFVVIIVASLVGALLPEELQPKVYYSGWFIALLVLFGLNTLVCTAARLGLGKKKLGSGLTHLSVLVILLGAMVSFFFSVRGVLELEEGRSKDAIVVSQEDKAQCSFHRLGFSVRLDDFSMSWYAVRPEKYDIGVLVKDKDVRRYYSLAPGSRQEVADTGYTVEVLDYMPDFSLTEDMKPAGRSEMPNNPAVLIRIKRGAGVEDRWVFSRHPAMGLSKDPNIKFKFMWMPVVKEFRSTVTVIDASRNKTFSRWTKVNAPFSYRGYTFYQSGYDEENPSYTSLEVVRDPGVAFVFAGFILLNAGLIIMFYPKLGFSRSKR